PSNLFAGARRGVAVLDEVGRREEWGMPRARWAEIGNSNPVRARGRHRYALLAVALAVAWAAPARADQIDDYVRAEMAKHHIPGLSLAVAKNGSIVKSQAYGLANVELNVAAKPDTVFK